MWIYTNEGQQNKKCQGENEKKTNIDFFVNIKAKRFQGFDWVELFDIVNKITANSFYRSYYTTQCVLNDEEEPYLFKERNLNIKRKEYGR